MISIHAPIVFTWTYDVFGFGVFFEGTKLEYVISHPVTWSFLVNIPLTSVFFLSTRIFYRHRDTKREARVERFFVDLHLPVDFEKEVGNDNSAFQAKSVGIMAIIYGASVSFLFLVPNPMAGRITILGISMTMILLGVSFVLYAHRKLR